MLEGLHEDVTKELARVRKENEILRQEREILKKAAAFSPRREVDEGRHMDDLHCALGGMADQEPSLFKRTIRRMKAGLNELEEANIILRRRLHHDA